MTHPDIRNAQVVFEEAAASLEHTIGNAMTLANVRRLEIERGSPPSVEAVDVGDQIGNAADRIMTAVEAVRVARKNLAALRILHAPPPPPDAPQGDGRDARLGRELLGISASLGEILERLDRHQVSSLTGDLSGLYSMVAVTRQRAEDEARNAAARAGR